MAKQKKYVWFWLQLQKEKARLVDANFLFFKNILRSTVKLACILYLAYSSLCFSKTYDIKGGRKLVKAAKTKIMSQETGAKEIGIFLSKMCQFLIRSIHLSTCTLRQATFL